MLSALIFDVDGTLADTESAHRDAFNLAFAEVGLDWYWDEPLYTQLLDVSGGKERIMHYWRSLPNAPQDIAGTGVLDTVNRLHEVKTAAYEETVNNGGVRLRPGVLRLLEQAKSSGLQLAIATTTSPVNVAALLHKAMGADWRYNFVAIGDASTAPLKKPHPQVYLQMLAALKLPASNCIAFEDSFNGLQAATAAGLATVITPTRYTSHHDFRKALRVLLDLNTTELTQVRQWHALYLDQLASATPGQREKLSLHKA